MLVVSWEKGRKEGRKEGYDMRLYESWTAE